MSGLVGNLENDAIKSADALMSASSILIQVLSTIGAKYYFSGSIQDSLLIGAASFGGFVVGSALVDSALVPMSLIPMVGSPLLIAGGSAGAANYFVLGGSLQESGIIAGAEVIGGIASTYLLAM
jgi:hypothetical protein